MSSVASKPIKKSTTYSILVGLFALLIIWICAPDFPPVARGLVLPTVHHLPASSAKKVMIYAQLPALAEKLGRVRVRMHYLPNHDFTKPVLAKARELAATVGANGLVIAKFGHFTPSKLEGGSAAAAYTLTGDAIYVNPSLKS